MHLSRPARQRRCRRMLATMALPMSMAGSGCASAPGGGLAGSSLWWFACLALLMVGAAAFALGQLVARQHAASALRQARQQVQIAERLAQDWRWQTD
ncbi:MAG: hypothetical protein Q8L92_10710, partial [Rubrivivax sp.]|nr:hypothetical protein [Rubrivivax sp.]